MTGVIFFLVFFGFSSVDFCRGSSSFGLVEALEGGLCGVVPTDDETDLPAELDLVAEPARFAELGLGVGFGSGVGPAEAVPPRHTGRDSTLEADAALDPDAERTPVAELGLGEGLVAELDRGEARSVDAELDLGRAGEETGPPQRQAGFASTLDAETARLVVPDLLATAGLLDADVDFVADVDLEVLIPLTSGSSPLEERVARLRPLRPESTFEGTSHFLAFFF